MNRMIVTVLRGGLGGMLAFYDSRVVNLGYDEMLWPTMSDFIRNDRTLIDAVLTPPGGPAIRVATAKVKDLLGKTYVLEVGLCSFQVEFVSGQRDPPG